MVDKPEVEKLTQLIEAAGAADQAADYRRAAALWFEASAACASLWGEPASSLSKSFLEVEIHHFRAAAHKSLYRAATADDESRSVRENHADSMIQSARQAIALLSRIQRNPDLVDGIYGLLIDGFDCLMASRAELNGMAEAGRQMEVAIDEYRKLVSPAEFERVFKRLLHVRATTNMTEAIKYLFHDRNFQAGQQAFKRAREFAEQASKVTSDEADKKGYQGFIELLKSMSNLGEALALQERGAYLAATARMKEAEPGFAMMSDPTGVALSLWAKAAQPYYRAMNDEIEGADDAAIKGYEQASKAFILAADAFPATSPEFASLGSWVRFYGETARERAKTVVTRKGWRQRQQEKAKRQAGLIFFGLWLAAIAALVAAIRIMTLSFNVYSFLVLVVICFLVAGVAAALIKAEVAVKMLSPMLRIGKKGQLSG